MQHLIEENKIYTTKNVKSFQSLIDHLLQFLENRQFKEAEKIALIIIKKYPQHQFTWKCLGAILQQTGRLSQAITATQKAIILSKKDHEAYYNLGLMFQEIGKKQRG